MFLIATLSEKNKLKSDLLVLFLNEKLCKQRSPNLADFPEQIRQVLKNYLMIRDFKGKYKETHLLYPDSDPGVKRILLVGLGELSKLKAENLRNAGYLLGKTQQDFNARRVHIYFSNCNLCSEEWLRALIEGVHYARYKFDTHKTKVKKREVKPQFIFVCEKAKYTPKYRKALTETCNTMEAIELCRNLANQPANYCTPTDIKTLTLNHFKNKKLIDIQCLDEAQLKKINCNAILAVAKGSKEKPQLLIIHYKPSQSATKKRLALVGKGVTFDSGGISIKPSQNMDEMKFDMSGGAAVIATMDLVSKLKPKFEVIGLIPLVENMPGSNALKPGDVIKAYNGKTIEVLNTDAEGRLILADALAYAVDKYKPGAIIDLATLTGSIVVTLGDKAAGLFSNSDELASQLVFASEQSGDLLWRLPVWEAYQEDIKSDVADIKNIGDKWGGAITAAKFLENFVGKTKWAHLDIAGTAYGVKNIDYLKKSGATGYGVRLLGQVLRNIEKVL